jgi:hypothetical protein
LPIGGSAGTRVADQVLGESAALPESGPIMSAGWTGWTVPTMWDMAPSPGIAAAIARGAPIRRCPQGA